MDMDRFIGRLLDNRYEILEVIGTGGMAVVYKARCHRLNRLVAVKILKDDYCQDDEFRQRFHAESQAVASMSHPNIVSVYDVSTSPEADYIVMELIDGISLKQYMEKKGVLNWKETLHFAIQIGKALEHAHSRGVVHRDIKPHNVMVLKNGSVKVADFGIARLMSKGNTLTKEALGSVHYISPEQAKGGRVDNRSDLYSLGVVMYEMMTGRPPYDGESPVAVAIKHINGGAAMPSSLNPNIPGGLEQIIMKSMENDPANRYASAAAMLYDMDEFRKEPTMLFDYYNTSVGLDDATKFQNPARPVQKPVTPPVTAAQRVSGKTGRTGMNTTAKPANNSQKRSRRNEVIVEEESHSKASTIAVLVCAAVIVVALVIFGVVILNQDAEYMKAPDLRGLTVEQVRKEYKDISILTVGSDYHDTYPEGQIIDQSPDANASVLVGSEITVVVSKGPRPKEMVMDPLIGENQKVAVDHLVDLGVAEDNISIRNENSTTVAPGKVTRTDPVAGETIGKDQTVIIWVSLGPEVQERTLPNVDGLTLETALMMLERNGFKNILTNPVESSKKKDTVVGQSHTPFLKYDVTTEIILDVSIGMNDEVAPPPEIEFDPVYSKVIQVKLPDDVFGDYTAELRIGDEIVETRQIPAGTISTEFEITAREKGTVEYEIWVKGNLHTKGSVELTEHE